MEDRYINPFSKASETYAQKLDTATIAVDHSQIEILLSEIEKMLIGLTQQTTTSCNRPLYGTTVVR